MSTRSLLGAATLLIAAGLLPGRAHADSRDIELGGFVGAHLFNDDNELGVRDEAGATSINSSFGFGFRLGFPIWNKLSLEGELALAPTSARDSASCGDDTSVECPSVLAFGWRASVLWDFLGAESRVRPFALAGFGAMTSSSNDKAIIDTDTDLVGHLGGGVKILVNERDSGAWGVRADARALFPASSSSDGLTTDFEVWGGVYVTFGGVAPVAKPETSEDTSAPVPATGTPADSNTCPRVIGSEKTYDGCSLPKPSPKVSPDTAHGTEPSETTAPADGAAPSETTAPTDETAPSETTAPAEATPGATDPDKGPAPAPSSDPDTSGASDS